MFTMNLKSPRTRGICQQLMLLANMPYTGEDFAFSRGFWYGYTGSVMEIEGIHEGSRVRSLGLVILEQRKLSLLKEQVRGAEEDLKARKLLG